MEINITSLFTDESPFVPFDLSNNQATLGADAGALTWRASLECAKAVKPPLLDTEDKRQEFRDWVEEFGAWSEDEIKAWSDVELNALFLQWVAGDVREAFGDKPFDQWDWKDYEVRAERGSISSNLYYDEGNKEVFFSISH